MSACRALVFGSLAQRSAQSAVLDAMFVAMPNALKVLDVNLRDALKTMSKSGP